MYFKTGTRTHTNVKLSNSNMLIAVAQPKFWFVRKMVFETLFRFNGPSLQYNCDINSLSTYFSTESTA